MAEPIILPKDHYFLNHADDIDQILSPLKRFDITTFTYMRKFGNNSQIYMSNNANWVEDYYKDVLYGQFISQPLSSYSDSCIINPPNSPLEVFSIARERYDSNHGAVFVKPYNDFNDFYFFSGSNASQHLINFYTNHMEIFNKFILYFQDRGENIVKNANNHKITLPQTTIFTNQNFTVKYANKNEINSALNEMRVRKYRFKHHPLTDIVLTGRELDTIGCLIKGMTAKETASFLNISQRTVETYFENIKTKLSCFTKADILKLLKADGFPVE